MPATVYLLHWPRPDGRLGRHYLGLAASEAAIDLTAVPHGRGLRARRLRGPTPILADVWDLPSMAAAVAFRDKLRRQGGGGRKCSICAPGNARGEGRGRWIRHGRT